MYNIHIILNFGERFVFNDYKVVVVDECLNATPNLMGRTCLEWLKTTVEIDDIATNIPASVDTDTIILFDDTPLVDYEALERIVTVFESKDLIAAELNRGYIFKAGKIKIKGLKLIDDSAFIRFDASKFPFIISALREKINKRLIESGVFIYDPASTYIDDTVKIEEGAVIYPNVTITGNSFIKKGAVIKPNCFIENSIINGYATINASTVAESEVGSLTNVGPYAYIRPGSKVGSGCKIGDFVEIKNSSIGNGTKVPHLAYVGDADVGSDINIGCGVIFANYDGRNKHRSQVDDGTFIGSNSTLIAPIKVGRRSFIAAGATLVHDVPDGALVIARATETVKEGRAEKYLKPEQR